MAGDPLRLELAGRDLDDEEDVGPTNEMLEELVERFDCYDYLAFAYRLIWLASIREALGYIPDWLHLSYDEMKGLVILHDESAKKMAYDNWQIRQESSGLKSSALSSVSRPSIRPQRPVPRRYSR